MERESWASVTGERPLVGRGTELAVLRAGLDATAAGRGRCLVLSGPFGMGKRRLLEAAAEEAAERGIGVVGTRVAEPAGRAALAPLFAALGDGPLPVLDPGEAEELAVLPEQPTGWGRLIGRLATLIARRAGRAGLLITMEGAQWADPSTLAALTDLVHRLADAPVMWLLAHTDVPRERSAREAFAQFAKEAAEVVPLAPLDGPAARELAGRLLGGTPDPAAERLLGTAAGNPFLLAKLVRLLHAAGRIRTDHGTARVRGRELPEGCAESISPVWHGLSQKTYDVLRIGSLLGDAFSLRHAAALADTTAMGLASAAQEAVDAGLLADTGPLLAFRAPLVRQALYATLLGPVRQALHAEVARTYRQEGRRGSEVTAHAVLGSETENTEPAAGLVRQEAAATDPASCARDAARRLLQRLRAYEPVAATPVATAVRLLTEAGDAPRAAGLVREALAQARWETPAGAQAARELAVLAVHTGHIGEVAAHLERALLDVAPQQGLRAQVYALKALCSALRPGGREEADRTARCALQLGAVLGDRTVVALADAALSLAARESGDLACSTHLAREAVAAHAQESVGAGTGELLRLWLASALTSYGRPLEAADALREVRDGRDHPVQAPALHLVRAQQEWACGRLAEAAREAQSGLRAAGAGTSSLEWALAGMLSLIATVRDDPGEAAGVLARVPADEAGTPGPLGSLAAFAGAVHLDAQGHSGAAVAHLRHLYEAPGEHVAFLTADPVVLPHLVRMARRAEAGRQAAAVTALARRLARRNPGVPAVTGAALHAQGLQAGDPAALGRAVRVLRGAGHPLALASVLEDAGVAALRAGQQRDAVDRLTEAQQIYVTSGAALGRKRVQRWLGSRPVSGTVTGTDKAPAARAARGPREPVCPPERPAAGRPDAEAGEPAEGWSNLTPSELRVVRLVADGLTNRQVASRLSLSTHTIDSHLRRSFAKLGISRRVELARHVLANTPSGWVPSRVAK
ncbi:AAA family ATPase [Streptomyces sp. NPDC048644]|uniref:helix-turn-helix transcriptional regulator n=1 Tax=Streptomyces sp. NPDC048644 TaxID=3365582 RepID=UPI00371E4176